MNNFTFSVTHIFKDDGYLFFSNYIKNKNICLCYYIYIFIKVILIITYFDFIRYSIQVKIRGKVKPFNHKKLMKETRHVYNVS
jgi:hypothetical protein